MECLSKKNKNCVCKILRKIDKVQNIEGDCLFGCNRSAQLLSNNTHDQTKDTIPFILICKGNCEPFETLGDGFCTVFFRVIKIDEHCCATLELLEPEKCFKCCDKFPKLRRSGQCLTIDLDCFCGVQCLEPIDGSTPEWKCDAKPCDKC
ncbi:spore coat protein Z [Alkalibacillus filiformis]|uniref:Spore coat protein Z n=1 Tax=Alkalibacillus filiformis TaxID=200990 RepID=A0ABU0DTW8_9BACI|nr:spore coat protein Z [Alkalibacillus filiformis]